MNLKGAGEVMRDGRAETLAYCEWGVPPLPGRVASQRAVVLTAS